MNFHGCTQLPLLVPLGLGTIPWTGPAKSQEPLISHTAVVIRHGHVQ